MIHGDASEGLDAHCVGSTGDELAGTIIPVDGHLTITDVVECVRAGIVEVTVPVQVSQDAVHGSVACWIWTRPRPPDLGLGGEFD